eukprot:Awhi_evm1s3332
MSLHIDSSSNKQSDVDLLQSRLRQLEKRLENNSFDIDDDSVKGNLKNLTKNVNNMNDPVWFAEKLHEPGVIGLTGFSMATVLLGFLKVGYWEVESNPLLAFWGFFVGGAMQVQAGIYEHKCGNPFSAWAFTLFGWNWMATGLSLLLPALDLIPHADSRRLLEVGYSGNFKN